jgi:hypothetical protein
MDNKARGLLITQLLQNSYTLAQKEKDFFTSMAMCTFGCQMPFNFRDTNLFVHRDILNKRITVIFKHEDAYIFAGEDGIVNLVASKNSVTDTELLPQATDYFDEVLMQVREVEKGIVAKMKATEDQKIQIVTEKLKNIFQKKS